MSWPILLANGYKKLSVLQVCCWLVGCLGVSSKDCSTTSGCLGLGRVRTSFIDMLCSVPPHNFGFDPWVGKVPWSREWLPTPVFLSGEFHGQRSLTGYSPWGHRVRHNWVTNIFTFTPVSCPQVLAEWLDRERHSFHILQYPISSIKNFFFLHVMILRIIVR